MKQWCAPVIIVGNTDWLLGFALLSRPSHTLNVKDVRGQCTCAHVWVFHNMHCMKSILLFVFVETLIAEKRLGKMKVIEARLARLPER
jgi:hypothetical protein